jgi:cytoskeletal protein CcmA (bactofilin family)
MIFRKSKPAPQRVESTPVTNLPQVAEPSYICRDTTIEGTIISTGEIHIDGALRGSLQAATCLVDSNGHVQGSITAQYVVVRGRVNGPITAQQLTISKGGHVEGNVVHQGISIEQGAFVMGTITQQLADDAPLAVEVKDPEVLPALPGKY